MKQIDYPNAIKKLRAKLNISQQELFDLFGVSILSINRLENGHYESTIIAKMKLEKLFKNNNITLCEVITNENN